MGFVFEGFTGVIYKVLAAVLPLVVVALVAQLALLRLPPDDLKRLGLGLLFSMIGLTFFLHGVHLGFMPAGAEIGASLAGSAYAWVLVPLGLWLGTVAAVAEPAVLVLADEVEKVSAGSIKRGFLLPVLAAGVGLIVGVAMLRVLIDIPLMAILLPGYVLAFIMIPFVSQSFTSIAFDSGVVATGPMTATFVLALAVGAAEALGRDPLISGFGLVALVAMAPILSIMLVGVIMRLRERSHHKKEGLQVPKEKGDATP